MGKRLKQESEVIDELFDAIIAVANRYGVNSRTLSKILTTEIKKRYIDYSNYHRAIGLKEQWFDGVEETYKDVRAE